MPFLLGTVKARQICGPHSPRAAVRFYDWASEMPRSKRIITYVGIVLRGYAFYFMLMWAFRLPGVVALARAYRELFEKSGEKPRAELFDEELLQALKTRLPHLSNGDQAIVQWLIASIE